MKFFWKIFLVVILLFIIVAGIRFFSGSEDAWLCQNGQWIKHGNPSAPKPTTVCGEKKQGDMSNLIIVDSPKPNDIVTSPFVITGQARGGWFFEAVFPIELADDQGQILSRGQAQAQSDWTSENFVPFVSEINYQAAATTTGKLVFNNDNPSGLPQYEKRFEIPVIISPNQIMTVKAFFSNNNLDKEITCNKVFPVERQINKTAAIARAALEELLKGPTAEEKTQGYLTSINPGVKIQKLTITDGTAKVDFNDQLEFQVGGSCRVSAISAQITQTLKQFSTVKNVIISVDGRTEDILQP